MSDHVVAPFLLQVKFSKLCDELICDGLGSGRLPVAPANQLSALADLLLG
jgi:hypothetical protein